MWESEILTNKVLLSRSEKFIIMTKGSYSKTQRLTVVNTELVLFSSLECFFTGESWNTR